MNSALLRAAAFRRGYLEGWRWGAVCGGLAGLLVSLAIVVSFRALGQLWAA